MLSVHSKMCYACGACAKKMFTHAERALKKRVFAHLASTEITFANYQNIFRMLSVR
jgi:hypothetical protein